MSDFIFTATAGQDMMNLWEFIAKDDIDAADRVRNAVYDAVKNIASFPEWATGVLI